MMPRYWFQDKAVADYFEQVAEGRDSKSAANWVINDLLGALNKAGKDIEISPVSASQLGGIVDLIKDGTISGKIAKSCSRLSGTKAGSLQISWRSVAWRR